MYEKAESADQQNDSSYLINNGGRKNSGLLKRVGLRMNVSQQQRRALPGAVALVAVVFTDDFVFPVGGHTLVASDTVVSGIIPPKILFFMGASLQ